MAGVDELQKCRNLIEALEDASHDVKNYRTHCHLVTSLVRSIAPLLQEPSSSSKLQQQPDAREVLHKLNGVIEEAVLFIRSISNFTTLEKLTNQGEAKKRLESILDNLQKITREVTS